MSVDPRIRESIKSTVKDSGQSSSVSNILLKWLESLNGGQDGDKGSEDLNMRLQVLFDATSSNIDDEEGDS